MWIDHQFAWSLSVAVYTRVSVLLAVFHCVTVCFITTDDDDEYLTDEARSSSSSVRQTDVKRNAHSTVICIVYSESYS